MRTLFKLLKFLKPFLKDVFLSVIAGIATIGSGIGMLGTSAFLISSAALYPSIADLQVAIVGVRFFGISRSVFRYLERLISHSVNLKVLAHIRVWFYQQIEPQAPARLQQFRSGDLLSRIMSDFETLENFYVRVVSPMIVAGVITTGLSIFVGGYLFELGVILFGGMFINGFVLPGISILLTRKRGEQLLSTRSALSASMVEFFQGLEDLQAGGAEDRWLQNIRESEKRLGSLQRFNGMLSGINDGLVLLVMNCTVLAVLITAIPRVNDGTITGVSLAVVTLLTMAGFEATSPLPLAAQNLTASIAAGKRLFEFSLPAVDQPHKISKIALRKNVRRVDLKNIQFHYSASDEFSLHEVTLTLERGQKVALVGPSGAGKSSLVNLLLRFWKQQGGQFLIDGTDIQSYSEEDIRSLFGVISQSTYIFSESLRNNLLLAKPNASDVEIHEVLEKVELATWFKNLPQGLGTWLGERGNKMSGGERQRLAIARVLLQDSPFVILDEPTSNLDPQTEKRIISAIFSAFSDRGMLLITHQMNLLAQMDQIYFMSGGRIIESGNENELLHRNGDYNRFFQLQNQIINE